MRGTHVHEGRIALTTEEHSAIDKLLAKHGSVASLTRRDPGESGPVLVRIGDDTWEVDEDGSAVKQRKAKQRVVR